MLHLIICEVKTVFIHVIECFSAGLRTLSRAMKAFTSAEPAVCTVRLRTPPG